MTAISADQLTVTMEGERVCIALRSSAADVTLYLTQDHMEAMRLSALVKSMACRASDVRDQAQALNQGLTPA